MPFALGLVRKLAAEGREIYAADDHLLSPGNHSKYVAGHSSIRRRAATPRASSTSSSGSSRSTRSTWSCRPSRRRSTSRPRSSGSASRTNVFASPFRTMARLHDKGPFERLVTQLGLPIPETVVVTSDDELRDATGRLERYLPAASSHAAGSVV
jgi:hypothetical protein